MFLNLLQVGSLVKLYEKVEPLLEGPAEWTVWVTELARWFSCSVGVGQSSAVRQLLSVRGSAAILRAVDSGDRFNLLRLERCQDLPSIPGRGTFPRVVWDAHCHMDVWCERNRLDAVSRIEDMRTFNAITSYAWPGRWYWSEREAHWWPRGSSCGRLSGSTPEKPSAHH